MTRERQFQVRLVLPSLDVISGLEVDNECMPIRRREDGTIEMLAIIPETTLQKLRSMDANEVSMEVIGDPEAEVRPSSEIVSRTNRYGDGSLPPGLGRSRR